jgi:flavin reductase (DIM6/NTAB) family NADH-FMN oxidoreductase RutF
MATAINDTDRLKTFGRMTYGIYVLTTCHEDKINGMIASWVSQVSYAPPLIIAAVHPHRYCHTLMDQSRAFALHIIDHTQKKFLASMKGPDPDAKFAGIRWAPGQTGCPILADCLAWFECRVIQRLQPGNHSLFIGEVVATGSNTAGTPLCTLDYDGVYLGRA